MLTNIDIYDASITIGRESESKASTAVFLISHSIEISHVSAPVFLVARNSQRVRDLSAWIPSLRRQLFRPYNNRRESSKNMRRYNLKCRSALSDLLRILDRRVEDSIDLDPVSSPHLLPRLLDLEALSICL
jgi:hypothetical protein